MPKRSSNDGEMEKTTATRKSLRIRYQKTSTTQKLKSKANRVCTSSISSPEKPQFTSPVRSIKNDDSKDYSWYPENFAKNSLRSSSGSKVYSKSANGLRNSTEKMNGVEGFQTLRRSPRFSTNVSTYELPTVHNREVRALLRDFSDKSVVNQKENSEKRRIESSRVEGFVKDEVTTNHAGFQEWTKDQEAALQRAYFAANPSPHFWKKVSKQVPGKSAQECVDKIYSDLVTPPQPRSKAKKTNFSPLGHLSLSGSKLLEPTELNVKLPKNKRRKGPLAQKTLRYLAQKNFTIDQSYKGDYFSVLEPMANTSTQVLTQTKIVSTPQCLFKEPGFIHEFLEKSPTAQQKPLSRFRNSCQMALASPPVLKQVKNKALHEKYIDKLHAREAKRMAARAKRIYREEDQKENPMKDLNVVNAAKNALVSDAQDMINQLQHLQDNVTSDSEDPCDDDDNDDVEDEG